MPAQAFCGKMRGKDEYPIITYPTFDTLAFQSVGRGSIETSTYNVTVEKNYVHDIGLAELSDMAGIYLVGPQHGGVVNNNVVFNITYGGNGAHAFYIDQAASGTRWTNNIGYMSTGAVCNPNPHPNPNPNIGYMTSGAVLHIH